MKRSEKEILEYQLAQEQEVLKRLESQYKRALNDIIRKMKIIQADIDMLQEAINANGDDAVLISMHRSKVYQKQFQQALQAQIAAILEKLHSDEYSTIQAYLNGCYESGFLGALYEIQSQGVPLIFPIDQSQVVQAIQLDTKLSAPLYNRLGVDIDALKKAVQAEISRGIATSLPYAEIARNIGNAANVPRYNAMRIARTEGGRIQNKAAFDVAEKAKKAGADVVKQWSAALDARTRHSHARIDGEVRELEEKFSNGLMYPKDPSGSAGEVINCRCRMKEVPRWGLDSESTKHLGNTDNMTDEQLQPLADKLGISVEELRKYKNNIIPVKAKDYDDFRRQYEKIWNADQVKRANPIANSGKSGTIGLDDIVIGRSVGAKAKNYDILDLETGEYFKFAEGTRIQNVEVFAGKGTKSVLKIAEKYADRHGGNPEDWQHVKGHAVLATDDGDRKAEVHWMQCEGIGKYDFFVKKWED